jgi:hypothetical protein
MWFIWVGNFFAFVGTFFLNFIKSGLVRTTFALPLVAVYVVFMIASFGLFATALVYIINSIFDLINAFDTNTSDVESSVVFECFFYILNSLGLLDSLKVGISLLFSNMLAIFVMKATMSGKHTVKEIIDILKSAT